MFSKIENFDRNRDFRYFFNRNWNFSKIITEIEIFEIFHGIVIFQKFWPKSRFSNFWRKSKNFENVDRNRLFWNFWRKLKFSEHFDRNRDFRNFWPKSRFFFENLQGTRDFQDFYLPKSTFFFEKFDWNQYFWRKSIIFSKFLPNRDFQIFWP